MPSFSRTFVSLLIIHSLLDCFAGIWPIYKHMIDIPLAAAGLIVTSATLIAFMLQPLFGLWADHGYSRLCVLLGAALTFPMMLLGPLTNYWDQFAPALTYLIMFAIVFTTRIGQALFHPAGATIAGNSTTNHRSTYLSIFVAFGWIGYGTSQILFTYSYRWTQTHTEWLMVPGGLLLLIAVWGCRPEEARGEVEDRPSLFNSLTKIPFRQKRLYILFVLLAMMSALDQGLLFLLPELLELKNYPEWYINGGALLWFVVGGATGMIPAGFLADKFGKKIVVIGSVAGSIIVFYAFILLQTTSIPILILIMIATGSLLNMANPIGVALGQILFPEKSSLISGVLMGLAWALGSISPWAVGLMTSRLNLSLTTALCILGITGIIALACSFFLESPEEN